jgi:hypothetical protein
MDLNTLANLAEIIGVFTIVGGLWFALVQLQSIRGQRRDLAALEIARAFQNPEFAHALLLVLSLPTGIRAEELREREERYEAAAMLISLTLESVGIMVHQRMVSVDMVWELMGGVILSIWDKLDGWIEDTRREQARLKFDEWIQWLVTQLREHEKNMGAEPAFLRHQDWKP